jgi:hypothetical protein
MHMKKLMLSLTMLLFSTLIVSTAKAELTELNPYAVALCNQYNQLLNRQACMAQIGRLQISEAAASLCNQYNQIQTRQSCMVDLGGLRIAQSAQSLCNQYNQIANRQICMKDLGNLAFADAAVALCNQFNQINNRQSCFKSLGNMAFDQATVSLCNQYNQIQSRLTCFQQMGVPSFDAMIENVRTCDDFARVSADLRQRFTTAEGANADIIRDAYSKLQVKFAICLPATVNINIQQDTTGIR